MSSWVQFLKRVQRERYGTAGKFARALQVDPSHLSKAMIGQGKPFDLRGCFRLAFVTGIDLVEILTAARKSREEITMVNAVIARSRRTEDPEKRGLYEAIDVLTDRTTIRHLTAITRELADLPRDTTHAPAVDRHTGT